MNGDKDQSPVRNNEPNKKLCYYCKILLDDFFISCFKCNSVYFWDNKCEQSSAQHHQKLCASMYQMQKQHRDKMINSGTYSTTLTELLQSW